MIDYFQFSHLAEPLGLKMLSHAIGLSASGLGQGQQTEIWLQNDPWRASVLGINQQAAISTGPKRRQSCISKPKAP